MLASSRGLYRGYVKPEIVGGNPERYNVRHIGFIPRIRPLYKSLNRQRPSTPLRAIIRKTSTTLPTLWQRADMLIEMNNALVDRRAEQQVVHTASQLALTLRNADDFVEEHLLNNKHRPTLHTLWFHERGFQRQQHVISLMPTHTMIPFISLLAQDFDKKRVDIDQVEAVYHAMSESIVAHDAVVKRELCNTVLRCYVKNGDIGKALTVVHEMKANNVRRNFITYAPLFRHARANMDIELDDEIRAMIREIEGGSIAKALFIDIPRVFALFWVAVRWNWKAIWTCILCLGGLGFGLFMIFLGLA